MADSDNTLNVGINVKVTGKEGAAELNDQVKGSASTMGDLSNAADKAGDAQEKAADKTRKYKAEHEALQKILEKFNGLIPGLGSTLSMLSAAYEEETTAAKAGAVANESFITSMGPLAIAMLSIQAAGEYWDMYQEKVALAARAQEEAMKKIEDSTHRALDAVSKLNEALHPKGPDLAEQDGESLNAKKHSIENDYNRQKTLNRANEEKELRGATSPKGMEQIREKYELLDRQLTDWRDKQNVAVEGAMVSGIEKQIAGIDATVAGKKQELAQKFREMTDPEGKIDKLKKQRSDAFTSTTGPEGMPIDTTDYKKVAEIDKQIADAEKAKVEAAKAYDKIRAEITKLAEDAGPLGQKLNELKQKYKTDAGDAAFNSETNRQFYQAKGIKYNAPDAGDTAPASGFDQRKEITNLIPAAVSAEYSHFEGGHAFSQTQTQTITQLQSLLNQSHMQSKQILEMIVTGVKNHESIQQIINEVQAQVKSLPTTLK